MTDETTTEDGAPEAAKDPTMVAAKAAGRSIARTLYTAGVTVPKLPEDGGEVIEKSALSKEDFAEKRKEYQKLAKQVLKKLDKQGFKITMTEKAEGLNDDDDDDDDD